MTILTLPLEPPHLFVGEFTAIQHGASTVPPVHKYPDLQHVLPQQDVP
jgi:hypothetical protein